MIRWTTRDRASPEDDLERIFDIYVTDAAASRQGVGLGLPLSRRLARLLGGDFTPLPRPDGAAASCWNSRRAAKS